MEGRRGARPVGPPGVLRHSFADELPQARISLATLEERRRGSILVGPPKPAGESPQAPAMEYVIVAE